MIYDNLIIGAGPAGLAIAGSLRQRDQSFHILEKSNQVGQSWRNHYDRLHLHTPKDQSHLPHAPFDHSYPRYVPRAQFVTYLDQYARDNRIEPEFGVEVSRITRRGDGWSVEAIDGTRYVGKNVIVATGFNRVPVIPTWPGQESFTNRIEHSQNYRNGGALQGQNVLIVGMGNTGAEIAIDLHEHGARPYISIRGPVNMVPRDIFGQPTARTALLLSKLPPKIGDPIGTFLRNLTVGDLNRYGIPTPEIPPAAQLRQYAKTPVIDVGTIKLLKQGAIKMLPAIEQFGAETVTFTNKETYPIDHVILATGFHSRVDTLIPGVEPLLNQQGHPASLWGNGEHAGLYFIGFDGYAIGGVLRSIRLDAEIISDRIVAAGP